MIGTTTIYDYNSNTIILLKYIMFVCVRPQVTHLIDAVPTYIKSIIDYAVTRYSN